MISSIRKRSLYGLAAVLLTKTAVSIAQAPGTPMSMPAPPCMDGSCPGPQISVAAIGAPPIGPAQVGVITTGGMAVALQENTETVKNQPYQAVAITDVKQTLADGSHITQTTSATVARDSDGRTARVQQLSTIGPWRSGTDSSQTKGPTLTTIFDPVAKTHTDYTSDDKVAHVSKFPPMPPSDASTGHSGGGFAAFSFAPTAGAPGGGTPMTLTVQGPAIPPQADQDQAAPDVRTESLGSKIIEGIPATGTRTTTIIPAGAIGNDKDLSITRETWYSADLKLVIQSTQTDPRFGESTYTLTKIQRSEPDPSMFQVPSGYTVDKIPMVIQKR
ncbi:hypothetical protein [Occallatibacter riparius]|uniref:Uncharacterized protein n=1 Tax=Occallatibacter riparius TaxID=1002689 RepID=A0A9J7BJ35_9BACT|nr:hypothetical protein [Occallatibacter riparius]UWZ82832.1 hypothetical protein MOP44_19965 [Occallatibacter riparius]